jgi:hypothetical protein
MVEQQRILKQNPDRRRSVGRSSQRSLLSHSSPLARKGASSAPIIQANSVDLPLPDGPISVSTSPGERKMRFPQQGTMMQRQGQIVYGEH